MTPDTPPPGAGAGRRALLTPTTLGLGVLLAALVGLIELGVLEYTYVRLGIGHRFFTGLLLASLLGSMVNVPLTVLPAGVAPDPADPSAPAPVATVVAVNVGGAVIPTLLGVYLLAVHRLYLEGAAAVAIVAGISHALARPVAGLGIAVPIFIPPVAAAITALLLAPDAAPALAYAAGSLGTLLGADVANLGRIRELHAPLVSIGGAGTFDGIFLTGIFAVLLA
jgi:uncharacterized membrane protein